MIPWRELCAQEVNASDYPTRTETLLLYEPDRTFLQSIVEWILPRSVSDVAAMKDFIRWEGFQSFRHDSGDRRAVDLIFQKGLYIAGGDIDRALFMCFFGTMDHAKFGVRIPLLGCVAWIPLTTESEENFQTRHRHLPSRIYPESQGGTYGDKDKLQHFFGSAFLIYLSGSGTYTNIMGDWMEKLEQRYVVDGVDDPRDHRANRQGAQFGKMLFAGMNVLPCDVLVDSDEKQEN